MTSSHEPGRVEGIHLRLMRHAGLLALLPVISLRIPHNTTFTRRCCEHLYTVTRPMHGPMLARMLFHRSSAVLLCGLGELLPLDQRGIGAQGHQKLAVGSDDSTDNQVREWLPVGSDDSADNQCRTRVRIVVLSDTHGFEAQLSPGTTSTLPAGDVLVHCGDFSRDGGGRASSAVRFDEWLATQPHPHKLVVRGNHDRASSTFGVSGAYYASAKCRTTTVYGLTFGLVPYSRHPLSTVPECDILVTHEPPRQVRDLCRRGYCVGSESLRYAVEASAKKPRLWLCGHIHEGRGAERVRFRSRQRQRGPTVCSKQDGNVAKWRGAAAEEHSVPPGRWVGETVVVNAANANDGLAKRLVCGPIVIDLYV